MLCGLELNFDCIILLPPVCLIDMVCYELGVRAVPRAHYRQSGKTILPHTHDRNAIAGSVRDRDPDNKTKCVVYARTHNNATSAVVTGMPHLRLHQGKVGCRYGQPAEKPGIRSTIAGLSRRKRFCHYAGEPETP